MKKYVYLTAMVVVFMLVFQGLTLAYQIGSDSASDFEKGQLTDGIKVEGTALTLDFESENFNASLSGNIEDYNFSSAPKIVSDSSGNLFAVWAESGDIMFAKSDDGGVTWISKVKINDTDELCPDTDYSAVLPDLEIHEGVEKTTLYVVWAENRDPFKSCQQFFYNVWFSASQDFGATWIENKVVNNYPSLSGTGIYDTHSWEIGRPKVAVGNNHEVLVTWASDEIMPYDYDVYYSKADNKFPSYIFDADRTTICDPYDDEGLFSFRSLRCEDAKVDDNAGNVHSAMPSIAVDKESGKVAIAYEDSRDGTKGSNIYTVFFNEYSSYESVFPLVGNQIMPYSPAPYRIIARSVRVDTDSVNFSENPKIYFDGKFYIIWEEIVEDGLFDTKNNISFSNSSDFTTFAIPLVVEETESGSESLLTDLFDSTILVDKSDTFEKIYILYNLQNEKALKLAASIDSGTTFSKTAVYTGNTSFHSGDLVKDYINNMLYIIWSDNNAVYSTRSFDEGVTFGQAYPAPESIKTYTSEVFDLREGASFDGMKIKWNQDVSTGGQIKFQMRSGLTKEEIILEDFVGPNFDSDTYYEYDANGVYISKKHNDDKYIQYKVYFIPSKLRITAPKLYSVDIHYDAEDEEEVKITTIVTTCEIQNDCPAGNVCLDGVCSAEIAPCAEDADCEEGFWCNLYTGVCEEEISYCTVADDCEQGETCFEGLCVDEDAPQGLTEDDCGPFSDVDSSDPSCDAIRFVYDQQIFDGYPDGTFGPDNVIIRAETAKVILEAFNKGPYPVSGLNLGFPDAIVGTWYMPFIEKAVTLGIIQGYPDGRLKPDDQVNKVELLKIFFKTSEDEIEICTEQPYNDVLLTTENSWFSGFVCFTKEYGLMDADSNNNFNPSAGMTRRDVAELFYRYNNVIGLE